jgi:WhiB family redox-sensing transcriptional regulator
MESGANTGGFKEDWSVPGNCTTGDPDALLVVGPEQNNAKKICTGCPVQPECLADALDKKILVGVLGGLTVYERKQLLIKHPDFRSWRAVIGAVISSGRLDLYGARTPIGILTQADVSAGVRKYWAEQAYQPSASEPLG